LQIVNDPHAVPDAILGGVRAEQDAAQPHHRVLNGAEETRVRMRNLHVLGIVKDGALLREVENLITLALPDGIVTHRRHAILREQNRSALILAHCLAVVTVAARHQHRRPRRRRRRQVQVRRDMKSRAALEHDLLDAITFALQRAHDARLQRRSLRQPADVF